MGFHLVLSSSSCLQCDNEREFNNTASHSFFLSHSIQLRLLYPYSLEWSGRMNHLHHQQHDLLPPFLDVSPCQLLGRGPEHCYPSSQPPSLEGDETPTPKFVLYGTTPFYDHLQVFGCACYPNTSATTPHKVFPRSTRYLFFSYSPDHKGYHCLDLLTHNIIISRHVVFDKDDFPLVKSSSPTNLDSLLDSDPIPPPPRSLLTVPHKAQMPPLVPLPVLQAA
jgi:hypothetical protein